MRMKSNDSGALSRFGLLQTLRAVCSGVILQAAIRVEGRFNGLMFRAATNARAARSSASMLWACSVLREMASSHSSSEVGTEWEVVHLQRLRSHPDAGCVCESTQGHSTAAGRPRAGLPSRASKVKEPTANRPKIPRRCSPVLREALHATYLAATTCARSPKPQLCEASCSITPDNIQKPIIYYHVVLS